MAVGLDQLARKPIPREFSKHQRPQRATQALVTRGCDDFGCRDVSVVILEAAGRLCSGAGDEPSAQLAGLNLGLDQRPRAGVEEHPVPVPRRKSAPRAVVVIASQDAVKSCRHDHDRALITPPIAGRIERLEDLLAVEHPCHALEEIRGPRNPRLAAMRRMQQFDEIEHGVLVDDVEHAPGPEPRADRLPPEKHLRHNAMRRRDTSDYLARGHGCFLPAATATMRGLPRGPRGR